MATAKRRLITSIHNLTPEQLAELKTLYPLGFNDVMMRYDKPDGTFFYTVPYETEDTYYMVKIDVKVDDAVDDDNDGYYCFHAGTKQTEDGIVTNGGRVLGVTAKGSNLKEARANAYKATEWISFENKYMRNDIGKAIDEA